MQAIRSSYKVILSKYKKIKKGNVRLTQSSLLLIQPIDAAKDSYKFPILETDNAIAPQPEELRLNINDEFISYEVGYYLLCDQTVDAPAANTAAGKIYLTYAPAEMDYTFATLARAWDGYLQILVNKISRLEKWDLKKHNMIPWTQYKSQSVGLPYSTLPSIDYSKDGIKAMQPMLTLSGAKKNDIVVQLTNGAIPATASGNILVPSKAEPFQQTVTVKATRLALFFRGMLAQNASKFQ
jgi:hypothetical protein